MKLVALAFVLMLGLPGCASMNQRCTYYPDGVLKSYRLRSTVLGTGETEVVTTDCTALAYSTEDTGLSDNGKGALVDIADVVSANIRPGGQIEGAVTELIDPREK